MRTDITIDHKQVRCPNASHLGFDKYKAQVGDLLLVKGYWSGSDEVLAARMIGRIAYDPENKCKGHIVAFCISPDFSHTFERWIDPKDVVRIGPVVNEYLRRRDIATWFLSDELTTQAKKDITDLRRCVTDGWSTYERYQNWKESCNGR